MSAPSFSLIIHKKSPGIQVAEHFRIKEPETGNGKISYEATRKERKQRVNHGTTTLEISGNSRQNLIKFNGYYRVLLQEPHHG